MVGKILADCFAYALILKKSDKENHDFLTEENFSTNTNL